MSRRVLEGEAEVASIPERRVETVTAAVPVAPADEGGGKRVRPENEPADVRAGAKPVVRVWRCKVCGYLCARVNPPETCPICKVSRDRFEPFDFG